MDMAEDGFFDRIYDVVRAIPPGRVTSYGAIARYLGSARSARLVGWALNKSGGVLPPVPAHRVLNRQGRLTGQAFFAYPEQMRELLEAEGLEVVGQQVCDFDEVFWDPALDLRRGRAR